MRWFTDLKTKYKLFVGFGLTIILFVFVNIIAYTSIVGLQKTLGNLFENEIPLSMEISKLRININRERLLTVKLLEATDRAAYNIILNDMKENDKEIAAMMEKISKLCANNPDYISPFKGLTDARKAFKEGLNTQTIPLINTGKTMEAKKLFFGPQFELYENMRTSALKLGEMSDQNNKKIITLANHKVEKAIYTFVISGIIMIILGVGMALYITRIIANPLVAISRAAEQIAYGDLTVPIPSEKRIDEVGTLMLSFGMMAESQKMITREISDAVNVLAETSSRQTDVSAHDIDALVQKLKKIVEQYKV